jgi:TorA maturation chaperone TorD
MGANKSAIRERQMTLNRNRRLIYAFLSKMYEKEVTVELLKELSSEDSSILRIGDLVDLDDEGFRRGFEMLSGYLRSVSGRDLNEVKLELAVEYANLFLGVKGKPSHPSESVYRSKDQSMYQEPRDQVLRDYWNAGVDKVKEYTEPEDHIAIELQFMEYLCRKTVEALEKNENEEVKRYLQIQKAFIDDHLSTWVPRLTKDILEGAEADFYKGIAYITNAFVELERDSIRELIEETK